MTAHAVGQIVLLGIVVLACWAGTLGMWRMREPTQALHFVTLPAAAGSIALTIAVFVAKGNHPVAWKTLLMTIIMVALNSVGMHASARAFRARKLGHWEPRDGDNFEWVTREQQEEAAQ